MNKDLKKLFLIIILYSLSSGIFSNFQELWLVENNLSIKTVSRIFSIGFLVTVSTIYLASNLIKNKNIKKYSTILMITKSFFMLSLFIINGSGLNKLIKFLVILDNVIDIQIFTTLYPMITFITKDDKLYAIRRYIYITCFYIGSFIATFLLGKSLLFLKMDLNIYNLISSILMFTSFVILLNLDIEKYINKNKEKKLNFVQVINLIRKDSISKLFIIYNFLTNLQFFLICGLMLIVLNIVLKIDKTFSSYIIMITGLFSVIISSVILKFFDKNDMKKDYFIKYIIRIFLLVIAIAFDNIYLYLITIIFYAITREMYLDKIEARFINRVDKENQFIFNNIIEMTTYLARSLATITCGILIGYGFKYNCLISLLILVLLTFVAYKAFNLLEKESK